MEGSPVPLEDIDSSYWGSAVELLCTPAAVGLERGVLVTDVWDTTAKFLLGNAWTWVEGIPGLVDTAAVWSGLVVVVPTTVGPMCGWVSSWAVLLTEEGG